MTHTSFSASLVSFGARALRSGRLLMLALLASFTTAAMQPAQAQSADTWKSLAIIGGSTAVGAYVGHKMAGTTGAMVGAGVGATVGYKIDQRRRANEYSQYGYNGDNGGYYGNNGGYYPDNGGYYGNGGYDNGGYGNGGYGNGGYGYPSGFRSNYTSRRSSKR
ncbi:MAG: hypothetical protein JOZ10_00465 [Acidobacteria bacterium]|nr:hypothetical protein [Acidobacteriota bacterium]MBV9145572.1 hypothetical protein [Acidobacteriota bacterium]MBV9437137.1 hypothetical protein [Acidobacteriota bacterium]